MGDSLRDQLLKSGLAKPTPKPKNDTKRGGASRKGRGARDHARGGKPARNDGEIDLAKAYALRARNEAEERKRAKREAEEQARLRKELKRKLREALDGHALNKPEAELMRHFEYGAKIRRVHVDAEQLQAINDGRLGVIQQGGRYFVVTRERAELIRGFAPDHVALLVDPDATDGDDGVPDDLVW